jgi:hypothetical protein
MFIKHSMPPLQHSITLDITSAEAARILADFDHTREPTLPTKQLISALMSVRGDQRDNRALES